MSPLYLRVEDIPEVAGLPATPAAIVDKYAAEAHLHDHDDLLDRQAAWAAKLGALDAVFAAGRASGRQAAFDAFREEGGTPLEEFATWCALVERLGQPEVWPGWARDRDSQVVCGGRRRPR